MKKHFIVIIALIGLFYIGVIELDFNWFKFHLRNNVFDVLLTFVFCFLLYKAISSMNKNATNGLDIWISVWCGTAIIILLNNDNSGKSIEGAFNNFTIPIICLFESIYGVFSIVLQLIREHFPKKTNDQLSINSLFNKQ